MKVWLLDNGSIVIEHTQLMWNVPGPQVRIPSYAVLVEHDDGLYLFDTGFDLEHTNAVLPFELPEQTPEQTIPAQLELAGFAVSDVTTLVNSHLHFDHCGGNEFFPSSTFLVQRAEMDAARRVLGGEAMRYTPSAIDFDHPLDYQLVDGEHDLFGDGQLVLLPTYGHTPGHQSLLVRAGKGTELVLTADACYTRENMDRDILPTVLWEPAEMSRSLGMLRDWRDKKGATVIYGHDAAQWQTLHRAPLI